MATVKTAISIQEPLFDRVNDLAEELQIPRSQLFTLAVEEFIKQHENRSIFEALNEVEGELELVQVFPDGPALKAGLQPGERIVAVDGVPWERFSKFDEVILAIVGEVGTEVVLTVRSLDGAEREVPVTRAVVALENALVQGNVIGGTKIGLLT